MIRHPYASAIVAPAVTTTNAVIRANTYAPVDGTAFQSRTQHNVSRSNSHPGLSVPSSSSRNLALTPIPITTRRPEGSFVLHDASAGVSLTLFGQEPQSARVDSGVSLGGIGIGGGSRGIRQIPTYGRSAVVDGRVDITYPETVTSIEAKLEGYISVTEIGGGGSSHTPILSETLTFWDIPPTASSSSSCPLSSFAASTLAQTHAPLFPCTSPNPVPIRGAASSSSSSLSIYASNSTATHAHGQAQTRTPTSSSRHSASICPSFLPFRTSLPTHYVDTSPFAATSPFNGDDDANARSARFDDSRSGSAGKNRYRFPLPPSFVDVSPSIPGFRCEVVYSVSVHVTRGRSRGSSAVGISTTEKEKGRGSDVSIGRGIVKGMNIGKGLGNLLGKRRFVVKTLIEYHPQSKPSRTLAHANLFPIPSPPPKSTDASTTSSSHPGKNAMHRSQSHTNAQSHSRSQSYPPTATIMRSLSSTDKTRSAQSNMRGGGAAQSQQISDPAHSVPVHGIVPILHSSLHAYPATHTFLSSTNSTSGKPAVLPDIHATLHLPVRQLPIHSSSGIPFALRLSSSDPHVLEPFVECAPNRDGTGGGSSLVVNRSPRVYESRGDGLQSFLPLGPGSSLSSFSSLTSLSSLSHSFSTFARTSTAFQSSESSASSRTGRGRGRSSSVRVVLARQVTVDVNAGSNINSSRRGCGLFGGDNDRPDKETRKARPRSKSESYVNRKPGGVKNCDGPSPHMFRSRVIGEGKLLSCLTEDDNASENQTDDNSTSKVGDGEDMVLGWSRKKDDKSGTRLAYGVRFAGPPDEISSFPQPRTTLRRTGKSTILSSSTAKKPKHTPPITPPPTPLASNSGYSTPNTASSTTHSAPHTHAVTLTGTLRVDPRYTCSSPPQSSSLSFLSSSSATGLVGKWTPVVRSAGFQARNVVVKDYVIVSVRPGGTGAADGSEYGELRMTVPVVLTTDGED